MPQRQEKSEELYNGIVVLLKACSKVSRFPRDWGCFPASFSEVTNATPPLETRSRAPESQAEPSHTKCQAIFRISVGLFPFISWLLSCPALCLLFFIKAPKCSSKFFFWDKKLNVKVCIWSFKSPRPIWTPKNWIWGEVLFHGLRSSFSYYCNEGEERVF